MFALVPSPPETRYARTADGLHLAYQVIGDGPIDLVFNPGFVTHVEHGWEEPRMAAFLGRLASFSRLVIYDKRGTGLSDPVALDDPPPLEVYADDIAVVMDAARFERAALVGTSTGGPASMLFAARAPARTTALVLFNTCAHWSSGPTPATATVRQQDWGEGRGFDVVAPTVAADEQFLAWAARFERLAASPGTAKMMRERFWAADVRDILPSIRLPTLVLHRAGNQFITVDHARHLAEHIPGATLVELPGRDHLFQIGDVDAPLEEIEEFLTGVRHKRTVDREVPLLTEGWPLVGRQRELDVIASSLADPTRRGMVLAGPPGVGKTRLATEALAAQRSLGTVTEMARATRAAASVPFGALVHLLPRGRDEGGGALPADRLSVLRHLTSAVADRAGAAPFVLAVDDAHLLDPGSAAVVHHLAATTSARVLLTVRTGEPPPDPVTALWKDGLCTRLDVPALQREEVGELLTRALGGPIEPATLARLWRITLGNTLFLHELVTEALEHGQLTDRRGVWFWLGDRVPGPRLSEIVHDRMGRLAEPALRAVRLLALGEPLPLATLVELAGSDVAAALEADAVLRVEEGQRGLEVRLGHPLYGEIVQAETPRVVAAGLVAELLDRRRAASAQDRFGEVPSPFDHLRLACWSLDYGLVPEPGLLSRGATAALDLGEWLLAERLSRAATGAGETRAALTLGWALFNQHRYEEADAVLATLAEEGGEDAWRSQLVIARLDVLHLGLRRTSEARDLVATAVREIADPVELDFVRAKWATVLTLAGEFVEAGVVARPLLDAADVRVRIRAIVPAAHGLTVTGKCETVLELTDQLLGPALSLTAELPSGPFWVASARVLALLAAGRLTELEQFLQLVDEAGTGRRFSESQGLLHIARGRLALLQGRPVSAAVHLRAAAAVTEDGSRSELQSWALCLLSEALALAGDVSGAEQAWQEGAPGTGATGPRQLHHADALRCRAWILAARGERAPARIWLDTVADQCRAEGLAVHEMTARHDAVRLGARGSTVERVVALGGEMQGALFPALAGHAAALAAQDGEGLTASASRFEDIGALLLAAEAAAQAAAVFGAAGLRSRASEADVRSAALGERCEGARTPVLLERPELSHLTSREREVATLAASALTSAEIGRRLNLSPRTVDNYLQRAYRKLGIRRREELPAALGHLAED